MMLINIVKTLRWSASLGVKFISVVSLHTFLIVTFTLVSQLSTLLASILPLKVVILLGSDGIPTYFPEFLFNVNSDAVIAGLSLATLAFFVVHLLAERLVSWSTSLATNQLLSKSHKMVLFENQDQVAAGGYQRYSRAFASGVFIFFSLCGLGFFYPEVVLVILLYAVLTFFLVWFLQANSSIIREKLETQLRDVLNIVSGTGFFVAFGYLILDFIFWEMPGVTIAIVTLILSRQIMARATGLILDLSALYQQRVKLDALFFHGKVLMADSNQHDRSIWPLVQPNTRDKWINALLNELASCNEMQAVSKWHQTGQANVAALKIEAGSCHYLVKLFEQNRSSLALHEATLMGESVPGLPAPYLVGATEIQKFHSLLYELPQGHSPQTNEVQPLIQPLRRQLMSAEPPSQLCHRFRRSRPMLWQRLNIELLNHLRLAVINTEQQAVMDWLLENLNSLKSILQSLPLVLHQPDFSQDAIWVTEKGSPMLLNWGQWSLEPLGAGWPEAPKGLKQLEPALIEAAKNRPALSRVTIKEAELSALAFALERECNRQRYVQALRLIPELVERMKASDKFIAFETGDE